MPEQIWFVKTAAGAVICRCFGDGKRVILDSDEQRHKGLEWLESKWKRPAFVAYRKLRHIVGEAVRGKG